MQTGDWNLLLYFLILVVAETLMPLIGEVLESY